MNLEIHHSGKYEYLDNIKENIAKKIGAVKKNEFLSSKTKKAVIKALKRSFSNEKKTSGYNNF